MNKVFTVVVNVNMLPINSGRIKTKKHTAYFAGEDESAAYSQAQLYYGSNSVIEIRQADYKETVQYYRNKLKALHEDMRAIPGNASFVEHAIDSVSDALYNLDEFLK